MKELKTLELSEKRSFSLIACIPAFNEERTIAGVVLRSMKHVDRVLVCDDGSVDMTAEIAERLGAEVIRHERNMGKGAALKDLFAEVRRLGPGIVVVLDADGQHDPDEIPKLVKPIREGFADIVVGSRFVEGSNLDAPIYRRLGLGFLNLLNNKMLRPMVRDTQSGFRAYNIKALDRMVFFESSGFGVESELLALASREGLRVVEVPVNVRYRGLEGTSKRNPLLHGGEILGLMVRMVVEERPLLYLGLPGVLFLTLSAVLATHILWLFNQSRYFSIPIALITLGTTSLGTILIITALILYALNRLFKRLKG